MMQEIRQRIGVKLFFLLTALICLAIVPLAYVVFSAVSYFGNYTVEVNRDQIKSQAHSYLATIAREQAHKYDEFFSHVEVASSIMAAQAVEIYDNLEYYSGFPGGSLELTRSAVNGFYYTSPQEDVITAYWGGEYIPAQQLLEIQALSRIDPVFKGAKKEIPESLATHMVTVSGIGRYLSYVEDSRKGAYDVVSTTEYDLRDSEPLAIFTRPDHPEIKTMWTGVYRDNVSGEMMITASSPVVDREGILRAATGIDIALGSILNELLEADESQYDGQGHEILFAFLLDDAGKVIVFPHQYSELFGIDINLLEAKDVSKVVDYSLTDSSIPEISSLAPFLLNENAEGVELNLAANSYFVNQHTLHRLNWRLILVSREGQLNSSVERTEEALSGTIDLLVKNFVTNAVVVFAIILLIVFFAVAHFVAPLRRLSEAALRVGKGDLKTRCQVSRSDELGSLADSFNKMACQLQEAEKNKKSYAKKLELTVEERTRDLINKNFVLRDVIGELNAESARRKHAVEALARSEEQIRVAMDASLAGHAILQDKTIKYVNPSVLRIFGYSLEESISGELGVEELVTAEECENVRQDINAGFARNAGNPSVVRCIRKDGSVFDALIGGTMTIWEGKPAVAATVMDISEQKETEGKLRESTRQLQDSLAEKEVLLREIYHRTKNNMLVIISMLNLQAMDIDNEQVKTLFKETENRIRAMSLVHEKLYQSQNLAEIDLGQYLEEMVTALVKTMVIGNRIRVDIRCEEVAVSIDNIVPLGLAVNEIVTNSLKHAFPLRGKGCIFVKLSRDADGVVEVIVGDDGTGLPSHINMYRIRSFGMQITVNLIEKQLRGTMAITRGGGTVYCIRFKESVRVKRI